MVQDMTPAGPDKNENEWKTYAQKRGAFMRKMGWDERRMTKHEEFCSKVAKKDEPSGGLITFCAVIYVAALVSHCAKTTHANDGLYVLLAVYPGFLIPFFLALILHWFSKFFREDLPAFIPPGTFQENLAVKNAQNVVDRATSDIQSAYYDLSRYVASHWISTARHKIADGKAREAAALVDLAKAEKEADAQHEEMRARCLPSWPDGAHRIDRLMENFLRDRKLWHERHEERVASNEKLALEVEKKKTEPTAIPTSIEPVAVNSPSPSTLATPLPVEVAPLITISAPVTAVSDTTVTAPSSTPVTIAPTVAVPVAPITSRKDFFSEVLERGPILHRKESHAPRLPLVLEKFIPPTGFRDVVELEPEPNEVTANPRFLPPAGFGGTRVEPAPRETDFEAVLVAESESESAVELIESEPEPVTMVEAEPEYEHHPKPKTSQPEYMVESMTKPASVPQLLPASPPRHPRTETSARSTSTRSRRNEPEYEPEPAIEGGRKLRTNYAVVRNPKLREMAIRIHGRNCCICGFNFDAFFGPELAKGYIEVHHLNRIADGERLTDPGADLAPMCSNCHTMADRLTLRLANPPTTIADLKRLLVPHQPNSDQ